MDYPTNGNSTNTGKLPPLNPDDLKPPPPPPSTMKNVKNKNEDVSLKEVIDEIKQKTRDAIMGTSVSGILCVMRITNFLVAGLMILISIVQMATVNSFWSGVHDIFSVFYTIMFAFILIGYELRTLAIDLVIRENYGFMYSPIGRCLFLAMISIFPFGMYGSYGIIVSFIGFANAYFNFFVITKHPSFSNGIPDYIPPTIPVPNKEDKKPNEVNQEMPKLPINLDTAVV